MNNEETHYVVMQRSRPVERWKMITDTARSYTGIETAKDDMEYFKRHFPTVEFKLFKLEAV